MTVPGAGYGGYIKLSEIIEKKEVLFGKIFFLFKDDLAYADGKVMQGLKILGDYAQIKGVHYTSWENATQIRSMKRIEPSLDDPFVYISEPGKMDAWSESMIQKELGSVSADTKVMVTVLSPVNKIWIKASRNVVHYAIEGIVPGEIKSIDIQRRKAVA